MTRSREEFRRLAQELAALTPAERACVIADAARCERLRTPPKDFVPPVLKGGVGWLSGDLAARSSTATMAAEAVFLDTTSSSQPVDAHASQTAALAFRRRLASEEVPLAISPQICRGFLLVLTRQPVEGRPFSTAEALALLDEWRSAATVVEEDGRVVAELLALVRRFGVKGKQVHDANVVAVMRANDITRLATLNSDDFRRFEEEIRVEAVTSP